MDLPQPGESTWRKAMLFRADSWLQQGSKWAKCTLARRQSGFYTCVAWYPKCQMPNAPWTKQSRVMTNPLRCSKSK
ncbi:predicted protein [Uncinocarpus reesii 1704]|uniref:Uncharacterized protein n=1 Tax=Uncinocarpus reesii (strain UAMH 1704) TaxID=336963 RepID=C4JJY2_UNCRE|nr:uncharacterized protein UREG_01939 [Uncinocarpus reesii 1704]EEP77090.1 predicted protein [Uncinocarpus reesii 1704]